MFITIAVELQISGHESTREEIEAFRDKTQFGDNQNNGDGCYSGRKNCAERPGAPHSWMYVDDLSSSIAGEWELPGTPFNVILDGEAPLFGIRLRPKIILQEKIWERRYCACYKRVSEWLTH